ncbi:DEAD/DEAH box helicase family protein [Streptomyces sp. CoT10]|uniref:helicase associated domain-containing protein n=1 Tax=Streptomyces sp. CoT10 TaxID=2875762 RepID=UPI0035A81BC0
MLGIQLREHQVTQKTNFRKWVGFPARSTVPSEGARGTIVSATGSGKTITAAACALECFPGGRILVTVPTLDLLAQTAQAVTVKLGVWVSNTKSRRDKLAQDQLAALRELGVEWACRSRRRVVEPVGHPRAQRDPGPQMPGVSYCLAAMARAALAARVSAVRWSVRGWPPCCARACLRSSSPCPREPGWPGSQ